MTFEELLNSTIDRSVLRKVLVLNQMERHEEKIVFFPKYGFCLEVVKFVPEKELFIIFSSVDRDLRIFITDRNYRSHFALNYNSHKGDPIVVTPRKEVRYAVEVSIAGIID